MRKRSVLMSAAGALGAAGAVCAADIQWDSAAGGAWADGAHWAGGMAPVVADSALFLLPNAYTVTLSADTMVERLVVDAGDPTFDFAGSRLDLGVPGFLPPACVIGESMGSVCTMTLIGGDLAGDGVFAGAAAGSDVTVRVQNSGTRLLANTRLEIGALGSAELIAEAGGRVSSNVAFVGAEPGSDGMVRVQGSGTTWASNVLAVGLSGQGSFELLGGATAAPGLVNVGTGGGQGSLLIDGAMTEMDLAGANLAVGDGSLTVDHSGVLRAGGLTIGENGMPGTYEGLGGQTQITGPAVIGDGGSASATVAAGHTFVCDTLSVASGSMASASMDISGNVVALTSLSIAPGFFNSGTVTIEPGGIVSTLSTTVSPNGTLAGAGLITSPIELAGTLRATGVLSVTGSLTQQSILGFGTVAYEAAADERVVEISETATLGGTLTVTVADGFSPATDQEFVILRADTISGMFSSVMTPNEDWTVEIVGQEVIATFTGVVTAPADLNDDGRVDGADLAILLAAWGPCPGCAADLNGDSAVNGGDLAILLAAWG